MTDRGLLTLTQWLSPSFPLGSFAYSHGLEWAISEGQVRTAEDLQTWLEMILTRGGGWVDAVLLSRVLKGDDPEDTGAMAEALAGTKERWLETSEQGAAFVNTVAQMGGPARPARALPVAVGEAALGLGLDPRTVIALYLHSFTSNLVSAGVRFVPLGQAAGQRVLAALHDVIETVADRASEATIESLTTGAFAADVGSALHEDMDVRIFKT
ncbi:urease accessory protein UreF [Celeribacter litoreus]|uniref:urease accessory protein UreF n=1 Tax=Celeribacter litoreus TaxID=2876714 RepID=UPI001CCC232C|nr:urease accessory UreF family protein [Celeribacter litoreus]MCA0045317.1 urease accessory protein UreF [Celeribacter litoreus]